MTRTRWIAASVLALALTATTAHAGKPPPPPPPPTIMGVVLASISGGPAMFAAASDGRIFVASCSDWGCRTVGPFEEAARLPGRPVSLPWDTSYWDVLVCLENGDLYRATNPSIPLSFTFVRNVFTAAGTGIRLPDLPPMNFAPPTSVVTPSQGDTATTEDDAPEPVRPGAVK